MTDLAELSAPISENNPCGEDMSLSAEFDAIAEARRADDPSLDQGEWVTERKVADWSKVASLCTGLLSQKTKDIRLCVWLAEAWAHTGGFAGLASAYGLFAELCATHWETLHPLPDEDDGDEEARINNVSRLLQVSIPLLKTQAVTRSDSGQFTIHDLELARRAATQVRSEDDDTGHEVTSLLAKFEASRHDTAGHFFSAILADLDNFRESLANLESTLDDRLGADAPSFNDIRDTSNDIYTLVKGFAEDAGMADGQADVPAVTLADEAAATAAAAPQVQEGASGPIRNRAHALSQLRMVADYFRRAEPHSPVAYMAETAARWGEMPLHSWLRTVIRDDSELSHVEELLGLARNTRGGGDVGSDSDVYQ